MSETFVSLFDGKHEVGKIAYRLAVGLDKLSSKLEDLQIAADAREEEHQDLLDRVRELEGRL